MYGVVRIMGYLRLERIYNLRSLSCLKTLREVTGYVYIGYNSALSSAELPALTKVGEDFSLHFNTALAGISAPMLSSAGSLYFLGLDRLTSVSAPALTSLGSLRIQSNPKLDVLSLPALASVQTFARILNNKAIRGIALPLLMTIGQHLDVQGNDGLTAISTDSLKRIGRGLEVHSNARLSGYDGMPALACVGPGGEKNSLSDCSQDFKQRVAAASTAWSTPACS